MDSEGVITGQAGSVEPGDRGRRPGPHAGLAGPHEVARFAEGSDEIVDLTASELEDTLQLEVLPRALLGSYMIG